MRILAIGDVTSGGGVMHLEKNLWRVRREENVDFCVVNGENASFITGISPELAEELFTAGADVITGGKLDNNDHLYNVLLDYKHPNGRMSWDPMLVLMALIVLIYLLMFFQMLYKFYLNRIF